MSTTAVVLGVDAARTWVPKLEDYDEVVVLDPSVERLDELLDELNDPRVDYLLGGLPVLPLPDASVDLLVGAEAGDPEVDRVLRPGGRVVSRA